MFYRFAHHCSVTEHRAKMTHGVAATLKMTYLNGSLDLAGVIERQRLHQGKDEGLKLATYFTLEALE